MIKIDEQYIIELAQDLNVIQGNSFIVEFALKKYADNYPVPEKLDLISKILIMEMHKMDFEVEDDKRNL